MVNIIKQEVVIEESLKKKLELICEFSNTTLKIINGSIRKIDRTNLTYVEPHRIIINDITFLAFNYSNEIFIENLSNKIKLSELEDYLKKGRRLLFNFYFCFGEWIYIYSFCILFIIYFTASSYFSIW